MPSINGLLQIGSNALTTQQKAIDITGDNIANVNTPGYSRQRLNMVQATPVRVYGTTISMGVQAEQKIQRFHDQFTTAQLNSENQSLGSWDAQNTALQKVETAFDDVSGYGLSGAMSNFWNAWQNLANNPSGQIERTSLLSASQNLTSTFNQVSGALKSAQDDLNRNVTDTVDNVNQIASQIAELNGKISQVEVTGHDANNYLDERDQLVFNLSNLVGINSFEDGNGNMTISVGDGKPLVEGTSTWQLSTAGNGGVQDVYWQDSSGNTQDITSKISGGTLQGSIEARDVTIQGYQDRLNTLAGSIISQVNALHSTGYGLDASQPQIDFFTGSDASTISVNSVIQNDPNRIAAASDAAAVPGDNSMAIDIANLQNNLTMSGNTTTFDDYYASLVGDVGSDVQNAGLNLDHQTSMVQNLRNYQQEVSGVSLDEEMVNLIQYQHAYNAAAKLITTTSDMLDTIIGMIQ
jgi:flagellar hook-associated protein 1